VRAGAGTARARLWLKRKHLCHVNPRDERATIWSVNAVKKEILDAAMKLPKEERAEIAQELLASVDGEDEGAAEAWGELIRHRVDDVLAGRAHGPECRPFLAELRERLRSEK
jgi:hypothetical protein